MRTLIIGIGNPLLGDDGVGYFLAEALKEKLKGVEVLALTSSGFEVAERMLGYDRVIVIDAIAGRKPGRLHRFTMQRLSQCLHFTNPHDTNLQTAIEFLRRYEEFPKAVEFFGIEILPENEFRQGLSEAVKKGMEKAENLILKEIEGGVRLADKAR